MAFVNLPPNFQDIFAKIDDRLSKLETGPNQAMYTAVIAENNATQALNEAAQALAQATQAYNVGAQSLIKSANTITNASNQITGINSNGITVYSGASSTTGARVLMNSLGIVAYNALNNPTFSLSSSDGAFSTTGAVFTSSTITGGSLNINGNAIIDTSGKLTATQAVITGNITAYSGSFAGSITASAGGIGGFNIGTNYLSTVDSASGYRWSSSSGSLWVNALNAAGTITANSGVTLATGTGNLSMGTNNINNAGTVGCTSVSASSSSTLAGATFSSTVNLNSQTNYSGISTGSGSTMVIVATGSRIAYTTSSERFKEQIQYIASAGWLDKVAQLAPITYVTATDFTVEGEPNPTQLGLLAEDLADLNNEISLAVNDDPLGDPFSISYERLVVPLIMAVKELKARVEELESNI